MKNNLKLNANYSLIIMSILVTFFEIIRSFMFTGYSWFNFGQAAINSPLEFFFPVIGVHGLTLIIFLIPIILINIIRLNSRFKFNILIVFAKIICPTKKVYLKNRQFSSKKF